MVVLIALALIHPQILTTQGNNIIVDNNTYPYVYVISGNTLQISYTEGVCETRMIFNRVN